jgi:hypothetical protein
MGANEVYIERAGADGMMMIIVFGDRRGVPHGYDAGTDPTDLMAKEWPQRAERHFGADHFFPVHQRDEDALPGLATTFATIRPRRPRLQGSIHDDSHWSRLSDGSRVAAMLMSDRETGPMVHLSNNAPDAVETPAGTYATDVFRLVVRGNVAVGDRTYGAYQFRATEAGVTEGPVRHGPLGSTQMLVFADGRGWLPQPEDEKARQDCWRLDEVANVLAPFAIPHPHEQGCIDLPVGL